MVAYRRVLTALIALWPGVACAQSLPPLTVSGDVRIRLEDDWDSLTAAGALRPDRGRARLRARLGAAADLGGGLKLQGRLRTGADGGQQYANITFADFSGNPVDRFNVTAERYSLAWKRGAAVVEVGKMGFPFLTQNEYMWDADISPRGGAGTLSLPLPKHASLRLVGGAFQLPVGLARYSGTLVAGQAVVEAGAATVSAGLFRFQADRSDPDRLALLDGNGSRDYSILAINGAYRMKAAGRRFALTADLFRNLQGYSRDADPISRAARDQRTGVVVGVSTGDVSAPRHLQVGYRFFRMEKLSVDASYSHDDVSRLGTPAQAANTDLTGHDAYANYQLARRWTIGARAILSHRITTVESDRRARLDLTYAF